MERPKNEHMTFFELVGLLETTRKVENVFACVLAALRRLLGLGRRAE
jgi:hypothetical protein